MSAPPEAHVPAWLLRLWGSAAKEQSDQAVAEAPEGGTKPPESNPDGSGAEPREQHVYEPAMGAAGQRREKTPCATTLEQVAGADGLPSVEHIRALARDGVPLAPTWAAKLRDAGESPAPAARPAPAPVFYSAIRKSGERASGARTSSGFQPFKVWSADNGTATQRERGLAGQGSLETALLDALAADVNEDLPGTADGYACDQAVSSICAVVPRPSSRL